jgi:hypothetical protein
LETQNLIMSENPGTLLNQRVGRSLGRNLMCSAEGVEIIAVHRADALFLSSDPLITVTQIPFSTVRKGPPLSVETTWGTKARISKFLLLDLVTDRRTIKLDDSFNLTEGSQDGA